MHFGEPGNLAFLRPNYAKAVADVVKELGGGLAGRPAARRGAAPRALALPVEERQLGQHVRVVGLAVVGVGDVGGLGRGQLLLPPPPLLHLRGRLLGLGLAQQQVLGRPAPLALQDDGHLAGGEDHHHVAPVVLHLEQRRGLHGAAGRQLLALQVQVAAERRHLVGGFVPPPQRHRDLGHLHHHLPHPPALALLPRRRGGLGHLVGLQGFGRRRGGQQRGAGLLGPGGQLGGQGEGQDAALGDDVSPAPSPCPPPAAQHLWFVGPAQRVLAMVLSAPPGPPTPAGAAFHHAAQRAAPQAGLQAVGPEGVPGARLRLQQLRHGAQRLRLQQGRLGGQQRGARLQELRLQRSGQRLQRLQPQRLGQRLQRLQLQRFGERLQRLQLQGFGERLQRLQPQRLQVLQFQRLRQRLQALCVEQLGLRLQGLRIQQPGLGVQLLGREQLGLRLHGLRLQQLRPRARQRGQLVEDVRLGQLGVVTGVGLRAPRLVGGRFAGGRGLRGAPPAALTLPVAGWGPGVPRRLGFAEHPALLGAADAVGQGGRGEEAVLQVAVGGQQAAVLVAAAAGAAQAAAVQVHPAALEVLGEAVEVLHDVDELHHGVKVDVPVAALAPEQRDDAVDVAAARGQRRVGEGVGRPIAGGCFLRAAPQDPGFAGAAQQLLGLFGAAVHALAPVGRVAVQQRTRLVLPAQRRARALREAEHAAG